MPANNTRYTLGRQWELLQKIPTKGIGKTTKELVDALNDTGFKVSKRQVERDLGALMESFPLECNDDHIPYLWKWIDGASTDLPGLTLAEALSMKLIETTIKPLLPASLLKSMEPRFLQAERKLAELDNEIPAAQWANKVRSVQPTLPLLPPRVVDDVLENLQEALLLNKKLDTDYQSSSDDTPAHKILNPLGLVNRGAVSYLVATKDDCKDARLYAIHRFHRATILTVEVDRPLDFSLDNFINSGAMQFGYGEKIKLKAHVDNWLAQHLTETCLCVDQKLEIRGDKFLLTATVHNSWQLEWWILSLGAAIEIISPAALRTNISSKLEQAASLYKPHL